MTEDDDKKEIYRAMRKAQLRALLAAPSQVR